MSFGAKRKHMTHHEQAANAETEPALSPRARFIKKQVALLDECVRERRRGWLYSVFCALVELGLTEEEAGHVLAAVLLPDPRNARALKQADKL
jgi:hypothetical protein